MVAFLYCSFSLLSNHSAEMGSLKYIVPAFAVFSTVQLVINVVFSYEASQSPPRALSSIVRCEECLNSTEPLARRRCSHSQLGQHGLSHRAAVAVL